MKIQRDKITNAERAAIWGIITGLFQDWKTAYLTARGMEESDAPKSLPQLVSQWKNAPKVVSLFQDLQSIYKARTAEQFNAGKLAGIQEAQNEKKPKKETSTPEAVTDYTSPAEQKKLLNKIIANNPLSDEALDALKLIMQGQRADKDGAKDKQIQRFYTPVRCSGCPIRAAFAKIQENGQK